MRLSWHYNQSILSQLQICIPYIASVHRNSCSVTTALFATNGGNTRDRERERICAMINIKYNRSSLTAFPLPLPALLLWQLMRQVFLQVPRQVCCLSLLIYQATLERKVETREGGREGGVEAVVQGGCAAAILIMSKILISCSSIF